MIYFTKRPKKITKPSQVKEMITDQTIGAYDELKKLDLCAQMCYVKEFDLALELFKIVDSKQIVENDIEYFYEVGLSVFASTAMIEEFVSILNGYAKLNKQIAVEILSEFFINNYNVIDDKNILEDFATKHLPDDDFKDYIMMISKYHQGDIAFIYEVAKRNLGRVVELDVFHQRLYYELALIALEEAQNFDGATKIKDDLNSFDKKFLSILNRHQVAQVPFNELNVFRKTKEMRSRKRNKEIIIWLILFVVLYFIFM